MKKFHKPTVLLIVASLFMLDAAFFPDIIGKIKNPLNGNNCTEGVSGSKRDFLETTYFINQYIKPNPTCVKYM